MHYSGPVVRPPHEVDSILLEVTVGCTHNKCTFCTFYKDTPYRPAPLDQIESDLKEASLFQPDARRVYALGGDPFSLRTGKLLDIAKLISKYYPQANIGMYAIITSIFKKSVEDLKLLRAHGINDLVIGIESGDDEVLSNVNKGYTSEDITRECQKLESAGINYRVIFLGGLAGKGNGTRNALNMASVLNKLNPTHMYMTSLAIQPDSKLQGDIISGKFTEASEFERIEESLTLIRNLEKPMVLLGQSIANPVNFIARIPEQKSDIITALEDIINNYSHDDEIKMRRHRDSLVNI